MGKIGIVNFSSTSFTKKMLGFEALETIDLDVQLGGESYIGKTLEELFARVEEIKEIPKTSQPSPKHMADAYSKMNKIYDHVIVLTPDKVLSGTHQAAVLALELVENNKNIHIIETRSFALSEAILCDKAIDLINDDHDIESIKSELEILAKKITTFIIPGSFDYLKMSGRVNLSQQIIGRLMMMKLLIKHKNGLAEVYKKSRGTKKLLKEIQVELENYNIDKIYTANILADQKLAELSELFNQYEIVNTDKTSIIMAAHFGPDTLGFAIVDK